MGRVAVIGAGAVGTALAAALRGGGLDVVVGVRSPAGRGQATVAEAIAGATTVVVATGLRPVWVGGPEAADVLDGIARLWFTMAFARGHGRHLAFRMLEGAPGA